MTVPVAWHSAPSASVDESGRWLEALVFPWSAGVDLDRVRALEDELDHAAITLMVAGAPDADPTSVGGPRPATIEEALHELERDGIHAGLVGVVGEADELPNAVLHAPGGFDTLTRVAATQIALRRDRRVPRIRFDPRWTVVLPGEDPLRIRVEESLATLADTRFGTRGAHDVWDHDADPLVLASGWYTAGNGNHAEATPTLLEGPGWTTLVTAPRASPRTRVLDLRAGTLGLLDTDPPTLRSLRFACLARPGLGVARAECATTELARGPDVVVARQQAPSVATAESSATVAVTGDGRNWIGAAVRTAVHDSDAQASIDRRAALATGTGSTADNTAHRTLVDLLDAPSFARLLREQRTAWARRWDRAAISIDGDDQLQLAVRFALFHLIATVPDTGEAAVGARGLSGRAYRGHVFWDADVFVLPFLAATHPAAARAMLTYRHRRLGAARSAAASAGARGARFPWESASDGADVTPTAAVSFDGRVVAIETGALQEHITADVAWAVAHYLDWTGDRRFATDAGHEILTETARYWASRVTRDADGSVHIRHVMGPDEYHAPVDDNAFTNAMVRANLRRAAATVRRDDPPPLHDEAAHWRELADALVTGYNAHTGVHQQFAGFDALDRLFVADIASPPIAADLLLGRERIAASQVIKQADVVMMHHLLPDAAPAGAAERDLAHYLPRTAHGSSLSPGIHAAVLARAGRPDDALSFFRLAATLDLEDHTLTTAGGLHLATFGSVWQALAFGFLGITPSPSALRIDPRLPGAWRSVDLRLTYRGRPMAIHAGHDRLAVDTAASLPLLVGGTQHHVPPGLTTFQRSDHRTWHLAPA